MSILISVSQITQSFAARPLFKNLTFAVESGERIGLIGPNGVGKSTLLRILASRSTPDEGTVAIQKGLKVGYLEQVPIFLPNATIHSSVMEGAPVNDSTHLWEAQARVAEILSHLHLDGSEGFGPETLVAELSGGWRKRVALARELVREPDLVLLDEPTNHLDVESILWLERFLARASFATLTVTHDRLFLQRISNRILELNPRYPDGILSVKGGYTAYLEVKEQILSSQEQREISLKNTLRRETEWLRRGAKARTTKQQARIQRADELKAEVTELSERNFSRSVQIEFQALEKNPKKLIEAKGISKKFGKKKIFEDLSLVLSPGVRIGLMGPNGCGKSTLIRVLLGQEKPDKGSVFHSDPLSVAYFEQNRESLDPRRTVLKTLCPDGDFVDFRGNRIHVRGYLDRFLFSPGQMEMEVGKLSGGEQSRLLIAQLMLKQAHVLVLDEPTNDLDFNTLNLLQECLTEFPGAVLLVTHDRFFLDQVSTRILAFGNSSEVIPMVGLEQWEEWQTGQESSQRSKESKKTEKSPEIKNEPKKRKKLSFKEQREFDSMEETIHEAESCLAALEEESCLPEVIRDPVRMSEVTQKMSAIHTQIDQLYARWAELEDSSG